MRRILPLMLMSLALAACGGPPTKTLTEAQTAINGADRGRGAGSVEDRELHHGVEQAQRLVMRDMLLRLRRQEVRQAQMGRGVGHGCSGGLGSKL